jgi:hypothetical protein
MSRDKPLPLICQNVKLAADGFTYIPQHSTSTIRKESEKGFDHEEVNSAQAEFTAGG